MELGHGSNSLSCKGSYYRIFDQASNLSHNLTLDCVFQAKRNETLPAVEKRTFTCEPAEANVFPVQLPVVIQSPLFSPPVRAAPSLAR